MPDFIEETHGGDTGEVVVSLWSAQENVLKEIDEESRAGEISEGDA